MATFTRYVCNGTSGNEYGSLTTSWSAVPSGVFNDASGQVTGFGTYSVSSNRWTAPASDLPDGVLVIMHLQGEDTSNGRTAFNLRAANISGTGTIVSARAGGYSRDNSEDRAYAMSWAVIDSPGASSVWEVQARRSSDAPNSGDEFVNGSVQFIPLYYNAIGLYTSTSTQTLGGTTPTRITGWTAAVESDTSSIELDATTSDVIDIKNDGSRYLILGNGHMDNSGGSRTQREFHIRRDGTPSAMGVAYLRNTSSSPVGTPLYDLLEGGASAIGIDMAGYRGRGVGARQGGADVDGGISTGENYFALAVIELNSDAEVWRSTDNTGQQECALTGPVDLNLARNTEFNDSASYTQGSISAVNAETAHDALVLANIACPRNTSTGSGQRWTASANITLNGTEQAFTQDGDYNRGNQSTTDTHGWSAHPAGVIDDVAVNDEIGASVTELPGTEGGAGDIETESFADNEGLSLIVINLDTLEAAAGSTITASGTPAVGEITSTGQADYTHVTSGIASVSEITASGAITQAPKVWLNTTPSLTGATEMTVTAWSDTSITFDDAVGAPTGDIWLGVENRTTNEQRWIEVTVNAAGSTLTASGTPALGEITASGTATYTHVTTGSAAVGEITASGSVTKTGLVTATGAAAVGEIAAGGQVDYTHQVSGSTDVGEITASGVAAFAHTADGSAAVGEITSTGLVSSQGLVTATGSTTLEVIESSGSIEYKLSAFGTPALEPVAASGQVDYRHVVSGAADVPAIESSGSVLIKELRAASGTPAIGEITAAGTVNLAPKVWLNTTPIFGGATEMTVTAFTATSIEFTDPQAPPTGDLWLAVENRNTGEYRWTEVTVLPAGTLKTASGTPSLDVLTASGQVDYSHQVSGSAAVGEITASGIAARRVLSVGFLPIEEITASGVVTTQGLITATGSPAVGEIAASGVVEYTHQISGSAALEQITASGSATVEAGLVTATGTPALDALTATGQADYTHVVTGSAAVEQVTSSGSVATGEQITASGSAAVGEITTTGVVNLAPKVWLNATPVFSGATEMVVTAFDDTSITFNDPSGAPTGDLWLSVENRNTGEYRWIEVTVNNDPNLKTANGSASVETLTASGTVTQSGVRTASGSPVLAEITVAGITNVFSGTEGMPAVGVITSSGNVTVTSPETITASGTPALGEIDASGTAIATEAITASGSTDLPEIGASGSVAVVDGLKTASGTVAIADLTATGFAGTETGLKLATGSPSIGPITATGQTEYRHVVSGDVTLPEVESTGQVDYTHKVTGSADIGEIEADGDITRTLFASGAAALEDIAATGSVLVRDTTAPTEKEFIELQPRDRVAEMQVRDRVIERAATERAAERGETSRIVEAKVRDRSGDA